MLVVHSLLLSYLFSGYGGAKKEGVRGREWGGGKVKMGPWRMEGGASHDSPPPSSPASCPPLVKYKNRLIVKVIVTENNQGLSKIIARNECCTICSKILQQVQTSHSILNSKASNAV